MVCVFVHRVYSHVCVWTAQSVQYDIYFMVLEMRIGTKIQMQNHEHRGLYGLIFVIGVAD